jgi:uncharacterized protein YjbI with pentapeptide repeats
MNADDMPIVNKDSLNQEDRRKKENQGASYSQNGNIGIGHMNGGVIKDQAQIIGESRDNKVSINLNQCESSKNSDRRPLEAIYRNKNEDIEIKAPDIETFTQMLSLLRGYDPSLQVEDIEKSSIKFILKGSEEGLNNIAESFNSGKLAPLLKQQFNLELENAQLIDSERYQKDRSQKLLAFTITGDVSQADIDILKAALIDTSDNDEEIKNVEKSRLVNEIRMQGAVKRNLSGAKLNGADLSEVNLSEVNLSEVNLSEANLRSANLRSANLRSANLSFADLRFADLSFADLSFADLSFADLSFADLRAADLRDANLSSTDLSGFDLSGFDLSRVNLNGASLIEASLIEASLIEASLIGTSLIGIKLNGADLSDANLSDADLSFADLRDANVKSARFSSSSLGISESLKQDLIARGAIFKDFSGDHSKVLTHT